MKLVPDLRPRSYDLDGRTVLVTGGADGIGAALAAELHRRGARIVAVDVADGFTTVPGGLALTTDVRDRAGMRAAVARAVERFGRLDVVVANAGVTPPPATLRTIDPDAFDRVLDVNLTGAFNTVHPALDEIVRNRGQAVVVASVAAFVPGVGGAAYMISKAAVEQLGRALRLELAPHGASATTAYFGVVQTALTRAVLDDDPLGRRLDRRLPAPLRGRITPERAAQVIADGIERRAPRTIAPAAWQGWSLGRGLANPLLDEVLVRDRGLHGLLRELEERPRQPASSVRTSRAGEPT